MAEAPKHKNSENLLCELRNRLKRLKAEEYLKNLGESTIKIMIPATSDELFSFYGKREFLLKEVKYYAEFTEPLENAKKIGENLYSQMLIDWQKLRKINMLKFVLPWLIFEKNLSSNKP